MSDNVLGFQGAHTLEHANGEEREREGKGERERERRYRRRGG